MAFCKKLTSTYVHVKILNGYIGVHHMNASLLFSSISGILLIVSQASYIASILGGYAKPSRATWIIWTALIWLAAAAMYASGALNVQITIFCAGDTLILLLSAFYGAPGWSKLDIGLLIVAAFGVALWVLTNNPLYALLISMLVNAIGSIPTYVKTWHAPEQEDLRAWVLVTFSSFFQALAIPAWTIADALQPILFTMLSMPMVWLILRRRLAFV